jgi:hypothetical protein
MRASTQRLLAVGDERSPKLLREGARRNAAHGELTARDRCRVGKQIERRHDGDASKALD